MATSDGTESKGYHFFDFISNIDKKIQLLTARCNFIGCISNKMLISFQDRLRIPWRGGAKQMSLSALAPIFTIPIVIAFAAINQTVTIIMFLAKLVFLIYAYYYVRSRKLRTSFFLLWLIWSVIYLVFLFQFTVPLLEVLPEENFVFVVLSGGAIFCFYCTRKRAILNHVVHANDEIGHDDCTTSLLIETNLNEKDNNGGGSVLCKRCFKDSITSHCDICSACILYRKHHSYWLNCCIGEWNYRHYLFGLLFAELSLLMGSNLTLTAICHPVILCHLGHIVITYPDDCTEVYDDYKFGIAFVIGVYALVMAFFVLIEWIRQAYVLLKIPILSLYQQSMRQRKWTNGQEFYSYSK